MKTLGITPTRWFNSVFEVPVIRRIPRCRHGHAAPMEQSLVSRRRYRRRPRPLPVDVCGASNICLANSCNDGSANVPGAVLRPKRAGIFVSVLQAWTQKRK